MNKKKCILLSVLIIIAVCSVLFILLGLANWGMDLAFWVNFAIPLTILTPIIYGIVSYLITKKIFIPNLLIFVIWFVEFSVIYYILGELDDISILLEFLCVCAGASAVSLASSAITKIIFFDGKEKCTDENRHI